MGLAAITGGIALAATADPYSTKGSLSALGGTVVAGAGVASIASSFQDSADAKMYESSLSELGSSLNIELAPRVMEMENKNIELKGDGFRNSTLFGESTYLTYMNSKKHLTLYFKIS